jgi:hypothetical protein
MLCAAQGRDLRGIRFARRLAEIALCSLLDRFVRDTSPCFQAFARGNRRGKAKTTLKTGGRVIWSVCSMQQ